ncbi:hypothetical protein [Telluribacter humicola]|uniref:hypothetical protein n=1 Tax=Telluribacter humicola TaxID=1720261 RepID=UPI001A967BFD|nr:hypothetical protein [Telluribacter humicola]
MFRDQLLNSLKVRDEIAEAPYQYYINKVQHLSHLIDLETDKVNETKMSSILTAYRTNKYGYPELYHRQLIKVVA